MEPSSLRALLRTIPDWPKPGVSFFDICSITENTEAFRETVDWLASLCRDLHCDAVLCPDARGFIWGSAVAYAARRPLHLARKPGKLPGPTVTQQYDYEYDSSAISMQAGTDLKGKRVLVVDDVLATGGTAFAIVSLLLNHFHLLPQDIHLGTVINLAFLGGEERIRKRGISVHTLLDFHE